jgi:uncharacterized protein (TIGR00369 family)
MTKPPEGAAMAQLDFPIASPFAEHLGLVFHGWTEDTAEVGVSLRPEHLNGWQVAHGGLQMTLMDIAMALAARGATADGMGLVTIELKTNFLKPADGELRVTGKVLQRSATMAYCEGHLRNAAGELCAHATGTFKYLRAMPLGSRRTQGFTPKE